MTKSRKWEKEDLDHLDEFIDVEKERTGAIALPGLESIRDQLALRLGYETRFEDHDNPGGDDGTH